MKKLASLNKVHLCKILMILTIKIKEIFLANNISLLFSVDKLYV